MSEPELPPGDTTPCKRCGWGVDAEILADTPDCPHGWVSLEGMSLAEMKGLFAAAEDGQDGSLLSLDVPGADDAHS